MQTTTALDIIKRAMRLLGVYSIGEAPSADESADALRALNSMVDSWSVDNLLVYANTLDSVPLIAGTQSYTIGPSGAFVTVRPIDVLASSYVEYLSVSYPLTVATLKDFNQIPVKSVVSGIPIEIYIQPDMPNITASVWPIPSADMTLKLWSSKVLQSFSTLTDVLVLPPGYERALTYSLAEELGPEFEVSVSADIQRNGARARRLIKRVNVVVPRMNMPFGIPMGRGFVNYRNA